MQVFKTVKTNVKVNEELTFEGELNYYGTGTGNVMYELVGCGLTSGKYFDYRDCFKSIKNKVNSLVG